MLKNKCTSTLSTEKAIGTAFIPSPNHCLLIAVAHSEISDGNARKGLLNIRQAFDIPILLNRYHGEIDLTFAQQQFSSQGFDDILYPFLAMLNKLTLTQLYIPKGNEQRYQQIQIEKQGIEKIIFILKELMQHIISGLKKEHIQLRYSAKTTWQVHYYRLFDITRTVRKYLSLKAWKHLLDSFK